MYEWRSFDRVMMEMEHLYRASKLPHNVVKVLKKNNCWKNEPYCSFNDFTYVMSDNQISEILTAYHDMKSKA